MDYVADTLRLEQKEFGRICMFSLLFNWVNRMANSPHLSPDRICQLNGNAVMSVKSVRHFNLSCPLSNTDYHLGPLWLVNQIM